MDKEFDMKAFDLQTDEELEQNRADFLRFLSGLLVSGKLPRHNMPAYRIHAGLVDRIESEQRTRRALLFLATEEGK